MFIVADVAKSQRQVHATARERTYMSYASEAPLWIFYDSGGVFQDIFVDNIAVLILVDESW